MAKKKEEAPKIVLERNYNIPLRIATLKSAFHKKAKKAISTVKIFIAKHMKTTDVKIGQYLNLKIWEHGMRNPPNMVKITATKDDKGVVFVELVGAPKPQPKVEETKKSGKKESKPEGKVEAEFKEIKEENKEIKEEKAEEAKEIQKEEIKEMQKEHPKMHPPKMPAQPKVSQTHPTAPKSV